MSTFTGFSEEDLKRIKSGETTSGNDTALNKKPSKILPTYRKKAYQYKTVNLQNQKIDDAIDDLQFDKCRLSIKPTVNNEDLLKNAKNTAKDKINSTNKPELSEEIVNVITIDYDDKENNLVNSNDIESPIKNVVVNTSVHASPDIVRGVGYAKDDRASHGAKMEELQLKQKLMEEQNKKRKEMLAKALDDRTRQTEEEVMKLDKIKKELQVLDGQFSQDVAVLRKKIDLASLTYSEAEKHYLKVEKEFLQAKIQLQKEKDKKELLTEHLCALITHNETRKAQKLETLMLELATNKAGNLEPATNKTGNLEPATNKTGDLEPATNKTGNLEPATNNTVNVDLVTNKTVNQELATNKTVNQDLGSKTVHVAEPEEMDELGDSRVIVDGVDQRTGKMVEFNGDS